MGLSPRSLKNKQRQLARDLETKLISKCEKQKLLELPPKTSQAIRGGTIDSNRDVNKPTTSKKSDI
jgi:hypothetical protein